MIKVELEIVDELTKVLPSPDVHVGVILAQVVEPALVHDEDPTSDDGSPAERGREEGYLGLLYFIHTHKNQQEKKQQIKLRRWNLNVKYQYMFGNR